MEIAGFFACLALWAVFATFLLLSSWTLDGIWKAFRGQPLVLQGVEGVVLLPWTIGLAAWESRWALPWRLLLVAGIAFVNLYTFFPWKAAFGLK
jgi:hypothetical protein